MDWDRQQAQGHRVARRLHRRAPWERQRNQQHQLPTRAGHGGFMKTSCEIKKRASQTWPWGVLGLFVLSLLLSAASAAQDAVTEWNLNAEKSVLANSTTSGNSVVT